MFDTLEAFMDALTTENAWMPEAPHEGGELVLWKCERTARNAERIEALFKGFDDVAQARRCAAACGKGLYYVSNDFGTLAEFRVDK